MDSCSVPICVIACALDAHQLVRVLPRCSVAMGGMGAYESEANAWQVTERHVLCRSVQFHTSAIAQSIRMTLQSPAPLECASTPCPLSVELLLCTCLGCVPPLIRNLIIVCTLGSDQCSSLLACRCLIGDTGNCFLPRNCNQAYTDSFPSVPSSSVQCRALT